MRFSAEEEEEEPAAATAAMGGRKRKNSGAGGSCEEGNNNPERRRRMEEIGGGEEEEEEEATGEEGKRGNEPDGSVAVRIDTDALDCSICCEPLRPPLYQCQNGHVVCCTCCTKICNRCHICSLFIGNIRCLALEKVIESIRVPCFHAKYGCKRILSYTKSDSHMEACVYAPCSCPISDCTFKGSTTALSAHFKSQHIDYANSFGYDQLFKLSIEKTDPFLVLCGDDGHLFLLLNDNIVNRGNALRMVCIRPSALKGNFMYEFTASCMRSTLHLRASVTNIRQWNGVYPDGVFLLVPHDFCAPSWKISLEVCIQKKMCSVVE